MSQNQPRYAPSRTIDSLQSQDALVSTITSILREAEPFETELTPVVLKAVADHTTLSTPDVLALRVQLSVDVNHHEPIADRVAVIVDAISDELCQWRQRDGP